MTASRAQKSRVRPKRIRRGLVLSGGGALGAYQAGAIRALHEAGIEFDVISATSIGTMNALAWNIPQVLEEFEEHWLANVSRLKPFDLARILSGKNPFQFHKSLEAIADTYRGRYPWDAQRAEVLVTLTDYETNQTAVLSTRDDRLTHNERELLMKASTAILHIGSSPIEIRGRRYFDGGYLTNVPIAPLLTIKLDEIWIIPLSPVRNELPGRISPVAAALRRSIRNPYVNSLIALYEQMIDPPDITMGPARKFVISPFMDDGMRYGPASGLLFSMTGIREMLKRGFAAGQRAAHSYREPGEPGRKQAVKRAPGDRKET